MSDFSAVSQTTPAVLRTIAANVERAERRGFTGNEASEQFSPAEAHLAEALAELGLEPEQQYEIGAYDADFYFPDVRLCVEVDGQHHRERESQDRRRDFDLAKRGIYTYRIPARYVFEDAAACARAVRDLVDRARLERIDGGN